MHHCNTFYGVVVTNVFVSNASLELSSIKRVYIISGASFFLLSEMELFASTDTEVDINVIQEQLKENSYPQYNKIVQLDFNATW